MNILLLSPVLKPFLPFLSSPQGDASSTLAVFSPLKASLPTLALGLRERDFKRFPGFPPSCLQRRRTPPPPSSFPELENRVCVLIRFPDIPFCQRTLILPFAPSLYPFSLLFPYFSSFPFFLFFSLLSLLFPFFSYFFPFYAGVHSVIRAQTECRFARARTPGVEIKANPEEDPLPTKWRSGNIPSSLTSRQLDSVTSVALVGERRAGC